MYQIDMANKFGTSVVAYYGYENGKAAIPIDLIVNVCRAFEVSVEKFMTESL